jgi:hypothetical protein
VVEECLRQATTPRIRALLVMIIYGHFVSLRLANSLLNPVHYGFFTLKSFLKPGDEPNRE